MNSIHSLISFVNNGTTNDRSLQLAKSEIGDDRMRVVAVKVLGWMKSQYRIGKFRPLQLKAGQTWSQELSNLMSEHQLFSDVLEIRDGAVVFNSSLSEERQLELCALADKEHEPRLMT